MFRTATLRDAPDLARIINAAFIVEAFFKIGDRTNADRIVELMNSGGEFLVLEGLPRRPVRRSARREGGSGDLSAEGQSAKVEAAKAGTGTGTGTGTRNPEPGTMVGCVYLECRGDRAYFGMLSIDPAWQGRGFGRQLIDAVEARARDHGCHVMDIHIVNLREELPAYYRRFGYVEQGTLPFSDPDRASRPCHFIVMSKPL
jgi:GNAT superfamily N-acetyltransferase